jgi:hypothetical protein
MNAPLSKKGVVATAMSAEGREMRKYLSPKETAELSGYFLELAREIVEPYLLADGTPSASFEVIAEEEFTEASTRSNAGNCC